jgi:hypothetical protein
MVGPMEPEDRLCRRKDRGWRCGWPGRKGDRRILWDGLTGGLGTVCDGTSYVSRANSRFLHLASMIRGLRLLSRPSCFHRVVSMGGVAWAW